MTGVDDRLRVASRSCSESLGNVLVTGVDDCELVVAGVAERETPFKR